MNRRLVVFASPIGNVNDISKNFLDEINNIDVLFCEDTRVTSKLLSLLNINKKIKLISFHKFNEVNKIEECIELIKTNNCGLISDAGYPTISDPGYILVNHCYDVGINVSVVDGPSSITHALAQCGFNTRNFIFLGFLERNEKQIISKINDALKNNCPIVFFESVHRINRTIEILKSTGLNNMLYIGRELTKKFETVTRLPLQLIDTQIEKGEFVLILDNSIKMVNNNQDDLSIFYNDYKELVSLGLKQKDACKYIASKNEGITANDLYNFFIKGK